MNPRTSPSGPSQALAVFSLSAPVAFLAGVPLSIAFNQVDLMEGEGIGTPVGTNVPVGPGVYFVECQLLLDSAPTLLTLTAVIASGSGADGASNVNPTNGASAGPFVCCTGVRLASETPVSPTIFAAVQVQFLGTVAGGNITAARLLISKLADSPGTI